MFSLAELEQISQHGISLEQIENQIQNFKQGFPPLSIEKAATIGDGLHRFDGSGIDDLIQLFEKDIRSRQVCKFVPASGAASRMLRDLMSFLNDYDDQIPDIDSSPSISRFFGKLTDFAFYSQLDQALSAQGGISQLMAETGYDQIVRGLLEGLNYRNLPKGLLTFHKYPDRTRTAVEEHLVEGAAYCKTGGQQVHLHFTVSPEHQSAFEGLLEKVLDRYQQQFGVEYHISFSHQKASTDTIAVDLEDHPFRLENGELLFRPAGHGALLANLNALEADMVFIKNIDNVVPDRLKSETISYKKLIGGLLLKTQKKIFFYHQQLEEHPQSETLIDEAMSFLKDSLSIRIPSEIMNFEPIQKRDFLIAKLNRPVRVCGMVENTGEPGGGPFWVRNSDQTISLQIVETAQIDVTHHKQMEIFHASTHFSPTDLVCGLRNYRGENHDLLNFVDPKTGFVAQKSQGGKDLKALELPGLWNGSMSDWNSVFVEVPLITFNPVKTINDLLRPEHSDYK